MREPISLKEILAVVLKKGTMIICFALVFSILAGGYQFKKQMEAYRDPANSAEKLEQIYQEEKAEYDEQVADFNKTIEKTQKKLDQKQTYVDNSVLMRIDPYSAAMDTTILAVTDVSEIQQDFYAQKDVSPSYFITKIQDFYELFWKSLALTEELSDHPYTELEEKYLKELITVKATDAGTFTITALGETLEGAQQLGAAALKSLQAMHDTIEESTYSHTLSVVHRASKVYIDEDLETKQNDNDEDILSYKEEIADIEDQIDELEVPKMGEPYAKKTVIVESIKWGVIGGIIGVILSCAWFLVLFLMRSRVESSRQMEQVLGVSFLGSLSKKGNVWNRLAQKLLGERVWNDPATAADYIAKSVKAAAGEAAHIAVISTLNGKDTDAVLSAAANAITHCGKVSRVKDAEKNPEAVALYEQCKCAIVAERIGVSEMPQVLAAMEMAKKQDVQIIGFVTV